MQDRFGRTINYLRISVTDRCNLRCEYCMPAAGVPLLPPHMILSFEEIADVAAVAVQMGITRLRVTGGEPLVRKGIVQHVRKLAAIAGLEDLAMSTNGTLLAQFAGQLAAAGLRRVNISLDTLDPERYRRHTRGGDLRQVLAGIDAAIAAGLEPVKLNCVIRNGADEPDALAVAQYASRRGLSVRYIKRMDLAAGVFSTVRGGAGGDCTRCNRLRLTSDGMVLPCLFSGIAYGVRELGAEEAIRRAVTGKPAVGDRCTTRWMSMIGG